MQKTGKLYLIPSPLGPGGLHALPQHLLSILHGLEYLVAERAKTARAFLKQSGTPKPISAYRIEELNEHTPVGELAALFAPVLQGHDMGVLSEAGCPGIADPGAKLVEIAHLHGAEVVPLVGPSSILLALMAAGLDGQRFAFHGYLAPKTPDMAKDLKRLEALSGNRGGTQVFMETPYRNKAVVEQALLVLLPTTRFCIAADLTLPTQFVRTLPIAAWRKLPPPDLQKRPTIFLIG